MVAKQVADLITFARLLIGFLLVWIGMKWGAKGLVSAVWLIILNWTGDLFDGRIARRSRVFYHTWIGDRDLEVDMLVSAGLLFYMAASGYLNPWLALVYGLLWGLFFWYQGIIRSLGMLFQAPIYGWFIVVCMLQAPEYGRLLLMWIIIVVFGTWPLFPQTVIPGFLDGLREIWSTSRKTN